MSEAPVPLVSIVVPVLNGEATIRACVASLLRTDYPAERREIVVVDNGSGDRTREIVQALPVTLLTAKTRGAAAARNRGIEASRGEILAFTDADCVVTTGWIRALVDGFRDPAMTGVEGEVALYPGSTPVERYTASIGSHTHQASVNSPLYPFVNTANVAFRREVLQRVGGFDSRFPSAEDIDLTWRLYELPELKLSYNPRAVVLHRSRTTVWGFIAQHWRYGRGFARLRAKYPGRVPWGWRHELRAWGDVSRSAWQLVRATFQQRQRHRTTADLYYPYLTLLRKVAVREGFLWGSLVQGR